MKKYIYISLTMLIASFFLASCDDDFGKKLFGPKDTVAQQIERIQEIEFINVTDGDKNAVAADITAPADIIFSVNDPSGLSNTVKMSLRVKGEKANKNVNFFVDVVNDENILEEYSKVNGYRVIELPKDCYKLETNIISLEKNKEVASSKAEIKIFNTDKLLLDKDYVAALRISNSDDYKTDNSLLYIHVKRKGGSGEPEGAAVFMPMKGDDTLASDGADLGINRNNLYYTLENHNLSSLNTFTIEGLIYVNKFKDANEQLKGHLAGISSVWGYEAGGSNPEFLLRFGDASVKPNMLQLVLKNEKKIVNFKFKEHKWYHIAATFDENRVFKFYINGRVKLEFTSETPIHLATNTPFNLGQSFNEWRGFNGMMSQVRIWRIARTGKELRKNAIDLINYKDDKANIVAYWKMNKFSSKNPTLLEDFTGNGYDLRVRRSGASSTMKPKVVINNKIDIKL